MSIFPEILVGAAAARAVIADRFPHERVDVRGDGPLPRASHSLIGMVAEQHSDQYRVVCMALQNGVNVAPYGKWGFSIQGWAGEQPIPDHVMVAYPSSPLTEDQAGFRAELGAVLVPVVESALAAVQAERGAVSTGGER